MSESRRNWTDFEDKAIETLVKKHGVKNWAQISDKLSTKYGIDYRSGKQCRQRWHNHLNPAVNKNPWTAKQQKIMFEAHQKYGNHWTEIAKLFDGRTDNDIKNHFYSMLRRSLRRVNKILGLRNSTKKIKIIKPSVLSNIFSNINKQDHQKSQESKEIAEALFEFSKAKSSTEEGVYQMQPYKKKSFEQLIQKLTVYNSQYELMKEKKKSKSNQKQQQLIVQDMQIPKIKSKQSISSVKKKSNQKIDSQKSIDEKEQILKKRKQIRKRTNKVIKNNASSQIKNNITVDQKIDFKPEQCFQIDFVDQDEQQINLPTLTNMSQKKSSMEFRKNSSSSNSFHLNSVSPRMDLRIFARTPQLPTPNFSNIFARNVSCSLNTNNDQLNDIVMRTRRSIQRKEQQN